jgi:hypothetical protein
MGLRQAPSVRRYGLEARHQVDPFRDLVAGHATLALDSDDLDQVFGSVRRGDDIGRDRLPPRGVWLPTHDLDIGTAQDLTSEKAQPARPIPRSATRTARPLKPAEVDEVIAGYRTGRTMKQLAVEFRIDRRTVSSYLRRAGIARRRGGLDQEQTREAARLYEAGWSAGRLAERFDVSADSVLKVLRQTATAPAGGGVSRETNVLHRTSVPQTHNPKVGGSNPPPATNR